MDRTSLKRMAIGATVGSLLAIVMYVETKSVFPMPESKPAGFLTPVVVMGACIGWACGEFRSRACPNCGTPMGSPHFPGGEGPGPIVYRCARCGRIMLHEDVVDFERKGD